MPKLNPAAARAAKIALACSVPFLLLAGAVAPDDVGNVLDLLSVIAGLGAGALHLGRPPSNLKEAVQESVELAEQAILHDLAPEPAPEAETATGQVAYQPKHAAADPAPGEDPAKIRQTARLVAAQLVGVAGGAAAALVAAIRARR